MQRAQNTAAPRPRYGTRVQVPMRRLLQHGSHGNEALHATHQSQNARSAGVRVRPVLCAMPKLQLIESTGTETTFGSRENTGA